MGDELDLRQLRRDHRLLGTDQRVRRTGAVQVDHLAPGTHDPRADVGVHTVVDCRRAFHDPDSATDHRQKPVENSVTHKGLREPRRVLSRTRPRSASPSHR